MMTKSTRAYQLQARDRGDSSKPSSIDDDAALLVPVWERVQGSPRRPRPLGALLWATGFGQRARERRLIVRLSGLVIELPLELVRLQLTGHWGSFRAPVWRCAAREGEVSPRGRVKVLLGRSARRWGKPTGLALHFEGYLVELPLDCIERQLRQFDAATAELEWGRRFFSRFGVSGGDLLGEHERAGGPEAGGNKAEAARHRPKAVSSERTTRPLQKTHSRQQQTRSRRAS